MDSKMEIAVLRRDGKSVHYGMIEVVTSIIRQFFGDKDKYLQRNEKESTEVITFQINEIEEKYLLPFIKEISRVNPLYAVRISTE